MKRRLFMTIGILAVLCCIVHVFKLNGIKGLPGSFFSWSHCVAPLFGAFGSFAGCLSLFGSLSVMRMGYALYTGIYHTYFGLPTGAAALYWVRSAKYLPILIPFVCMVLFMCHPVGFYAAPYTLYWLLPIFVAFFSRDNIFLTALGSTFTAHAVGSVLHLYIINPMTPYAWLSLIPVVALERLIFALGMYVTYIGIISLFKKIQQVLGSSYYMSYRSSS